MSLDSSIRHKRYRVKVPGSLAMVVMSRLGETLRFVIQDCSLSGLSGVLESTDFNPDSLQLDAILPSAKVVVGEQEIALGRVVVRRLQTEGQVRCAFSLVDSRLPIDSWLSHYLETNLDAPANEYDFELGPEHFNIAHFVENQFTNVDLLDRVRKFGVFFRDWKRTDRFGWYFKRLESAGPRVRLERKRANGRNDYIMFGSNDYLGLASHPEVMNAARLSLDKFGFGSTGTPPTSGHSELHEELMQKLASMFGREAAILYPSGFATNVGAVSGLCREGDLIVADIIAHASLHDGIAMSRATARFFKHNDMDHLERILKENRANYNGCLIITEGAFSMDGTIGRLDEIHRLSRKYNARYFVDQAHCIGVVGKRGLGAVEKFDLKQETDIIMGLFSKAWGSVGGFVVGSRDLCDWLRVFSRSYLFATSLPPSTCAATLASIRLMEETDLVVKLQSNIQLFRSGLRSLGADFQESHESAIFPVEIKNEQKMGRMFQSFLDDGIYVLPVVYPVVGRNRCRFRFSIRADHSISDLDFALNSLEKAMMKADITFAQIAEMGSAAGSSRADTPIRAATKVAGLDRS